MPLLDSWLSRSESDSSSSISWSASDSFIDDFLGPSAAEETSSKSFPYWSTKTKVARLPNESTALLKIFPLITWTNGSNYSSSFLLVWMPKYCNFWHPSSAANSTPIFFSPCRFLFSTKIVSTLYSRAIWSHSFWIVSNAETKLWCATITLV